MAKHLNHKARLNRNDEIDFLRDFDLLTAIPPEQNELYRAANFQSAQKLMENTYVLNSQGKKYSINCHIDQFRRFGPGIYLMFKLLKFLTFAFGIVSILAVISIVILVSGQAPRQTKISNQIKYSILKTTIYELTYSDFPSYVGLNFSITLILSIMLIYWSEKQKADVIQCLKVTSLASYSTVILKQIPLMYNQHELQMFLAANFGQITEIYTVRNFGDDLLYYKQMSEIVEQYKQEKTLTELEKNRKSHVLTSLFFEFRNGHLKLKQKVKQSQNYKPCFAFIKFKRVQDRQQLLAHFSKMNYLCFSFTKEQTEHKNQIYDINQQLKKSKHKYRLQQLNFVECEMQPCGILWENLHLTKSAQVSKIAIMIFLVILVLTLSIFLIFLLSAVQMSVMNSIYKDLERQEILKINDSFALISYCINLSVSQFYQHSDICSKYNSEYIKLTIMIFMIPLSISLFKLALTQIMKALVTFRRYAYQIKKIQSQSTIIFVFYFLVTGLLQLVIYLGSQSTSLFKIFTPMIQSIVNKDFVPSKITIFSDYSPDWYITASYNVVMIGAISFNLSAIGIIFYCLIRRKIFNHMAKKKRIQLQMLQWLKGYTLQIEYIYAAILTIIYFTLLFGGSIPILYPLAFISFFILYWSNKYVFIKFCAKPLTYNHSINRRIRKMIFGSLIIHCIFTPIFYKAPQIAQIKSPAPGILNRVAMMWYYLIIMILLIIYCLFQKPIKILLPVMLQYFRKKRHEFRKKTTGQQLPLPQPHRKNFSLPTIVRKRHNEFSQQSYSMHENDKYKNILRALYTINNKQRARKTCMLNKQLLQLYEDTIKSNESETDYRTLVQVIKLVRKDYKKYLAKHGKARNPYEKTKRKLYQIYQHSKKGQNHKYTLRLHEGVTIDQNLETQDNLIIDQKRQSEIDIQIDQYSNGRRSKDYFLGSNLSNLQKVIQADSILEASSYKDDHEENLEREKSRNGRNLHSHEKSNVSNFMKLHYNTPQESNKELNGQKL